MRIRSRVALTLVEVLVAIIVLSVGLLSLAGTMALTVRMVDRGGQAARAGVAAAARLEWLHQAALGASPACGGPGWRSDSAAHPGLTEQWELLDATGPVRRVQVVLRVRHAAGTAIDTITTAVLCPPS